MSTEPERGIPKAYLITFTCYGTWLHGDDRGSADRHRHAPGTPYLAANVGRRVSEARAMREPPYRLDAARRRCVLRSLRDTCTVRGWCLFAAHVRSTHVHVVLASAEPPERVMTSLKAHASRRLNEAGFDWQGRRRWTRHGSTRYLWRQEAVEQAVAYVVGDQGEAMQVYDARVEVERDDAQPGG